MSHYDLLCLHGCFISLILLLAILSLSYAARVKGVRVVVLTDTAVVVIWERVPLPLQELIEYRIYYKEALQSQERVEATFETFSRSATSGVIYGLTNGQRYQFQVTVRAMTLDGTEFEGEKLQGGDSILTVLVQLDTGWCISY